MNAWIVVVAAGLASFALRLSLTAAPDRIRIPQRLQSSSHLIAPAAFAALVASSIVGSATANLTQAAAPVLAVAAAIVAVARTRSPYTAILVGMPTFWLINAVVMAS